MGDTSSNEAWDAEDLPKHVDRARRLGFEEVGCCFLHYLFLIGLAPLHILGEGKDLHVLTIETFVGASKRNGSDQVKNPRGSSEKA